MPHIVLGEHPEPQPHGSRNVTVDVDILLRTRLLVQANSGGGKSFLLRRMAEQLFGKVQVVILDPEGEFSTLREKYGYVLVGKGGETPADPRSAGLVAEKLLELNASAVCDLYEMKPADRHRWVRLFLEALVDAPKRLWHPVLVIVDEAHVFCPEKSAGESEASDAMIALATRGRKRGFAAVFATQRLGKLRKDAAAELQNVLVGLTTIDIDRKRAADQLGIYGADQREFFDDVKMLQPGFFYALGRAISADRILLKVGGVETTHPEAGSVRHSLEPPPTPDKVKALLPKLADLPKAAEEKARTEADLRNEIRTLKDQIKKSANGPFPAVSVPVVDEKSIRKAVKVEADRWRKVYREQHELLAKFSQAVQRLASMSQTLPGEPIDQNAPPHPDQEKAPFIAPEGFPASLPSFTQRPIPIRTKASLESGNGSGLTGPEQRIVNAIAWFESVGNTSPEKTAVAFLAKYTVGGGGFNNPCGALRTKGLIEYHGNSLRLTSEGRLLAVPPTTPLDTEEMHRAVLGILPGPERKLLQALLEAGPEGLTNEDLAERTNYALGGGGYNNPRGRLRTLGLVEYRGDRVVPRSILFID